MIERYKERPTLAMVDKYKSELEYFLSAHNVQVDIMLQDNPLRVMTFEDGVQTEETCHWIDTIEITMPSGVKIMVSIFNEGIDDSVLGNVWIDAWHVQDQMYKKLGIIPRISNNADPYWKLWDFIDSKKSHGQ